MRIRLKKVVNSTEYREKEKYYKQHINNLINVKPTLNRSADSARSAERGYMSLRPQFSSSGY